MSQIKHIKNAILNLSNCLHTYGGKVNTIALDDAGFDTLISEHAGPEKVGDYVTHYIIPQHGAPVRITSPHSDWYEKEDTDIAEKLRKCELVLREFAYLGYNSPAPKDEHAYRIQTYVQKLAYATFKNIFGPLA